MIEKTLRINHLFDFYQVLLTSKQRAYMQDYYEHDYSLAEIAEDNSVSRQAIFDNIKRTELVLEDYENKLHLFEKFQQRQSLFEQMKHEKDVAKIHQYLLALEKIDEGFGD